MKTQTLRHVTLALLFAPTILYALQPTIQSPQSASQASAPKPGLQPPAANLTFNVDVPLVQLDVVVTDARGNIVTGLTKDDFRVTEAGQPQTIDHFETAAQEIPKADVTINSTADLDRLAPDAPVNIIVLDEFKVGYMDMAFARYSLKRYLKSQPDKMSVPTMLLAVSPDKLMVLHDYTQDKQAILKALDHHFPVPPDYYFYKSANMSAYLFGTALSTLERVAEATQAHSGHKNMIWIGRVPDIDSVDKASDMDTPIQQCINMLREARVTLYTADPVGVKPNLENTFQMGKLAKATGGKALWGRNDVDVEIAASARDGVSFYTLTYRPTTGSLDARQFRKIDVTLDRPGLKATAREGYYVGTPPAPVDPTKPSNRLKFDLASAATSTMVYDAVPIIVTALSNTADTYRLHIDSKGLVWKHDASGKPVQTEFALVVDSFDKDDKRLKGEISRLYTFDAPTTTETANATNPPIDVDFNFPHNPKAVRLRFVVRVSETGQLGTADIRLKPELARRWDQ